MNADVIALLGRELRWNPDAEEWQWRGGDVAIYAYTFGAVHTISVRRRIGNTIKGMDVSGLSWCEAERVWYAARNAEGFADV